jgi:integrase
VAWIKTYEVKSGTRYRVFWKDPSGKQHAKVFKRRSDARSFQRALDHALDSGGYTDPRRGRVTLAELWVDFVEAPPVPLARSTQSLYEMQWRVHIAPRLGQRRINTLQPEDVRRFLSDLRGSGVGDASIDSVHRLLRRLLSVAVRDRRLSFNPASGMQAPRSGRREMRYLSAEEVRQLASEVPTRYEALILTLAYAGLRIGEASALRRRNVDLIRRKIYIVEAASEVDGVRIVGETKTRKKRSVTLPPFLGEALLAHMSAFGDRNNPDDLVFTSTDETPISQHSFLRTYQRACRRAGIDPTPRVHDLRHTAVAFAIAAGGHPKLIQDMLGHANIGTTLDVYGHLFESLHDDVAERLEGLYREAKVETERSRGRVIHMPPASANVPV